jgi:hypothetical protein
LRHVTDSPFQDLAESRAIFHKDKRIDLRKYWAKNDDEELEPDKVNDTKLHDGLR